MNEEDMIHELRDPKKKSLKSSGMKSGKTGSEHSAKSGFCDLQSVHVEQSDGEGRGGPSTSTTFIPPWLKSSLGLNHRNNQSHAMSDQRSTKIIPRSREESNNETQSLKSHPAADSSIRMTCHLDSLSQNISVPSAPVDARGGSEKPTTFSWSGFGKDSECESMCDKSEIRMIKQVDSRPANANESNSVTESERFKEDGKRGRSKSTRDKTKLQKGNGSRERSLDCNVNRNDVDQLLEAKAREVIEGFSKKDVHSVTSEMKQLEAKLVLLWSKCRETKPSVLSQQELRLLQEIKHQTGNKEEFDKFMRHIRDSNLKEWLNLSEGPLKTHGDKVRKGKIKVGDIAEDCVPGLKTTDWNPKQNSDKESSKSTDEEGDIKRFSEFLSKNKNSDEKRKCLEEVRNYFERKRRTRLTKRRWNDQNKSGKGEDWADLGRDDLPRERPSGKDVTTVYLAKERKSRFVPCNEEVVEKAVSETLQKFMSLYHFHVSPTMMGNMRKNILQAIHSDPQEGNLPEKMGEGKTINENFSGKSGEGESQKTESNVPQIVNFESLYSAESKDSKKNSFKTVVSNSRKQGPKPTRENDNLENDNFRRLRKDFENCLKSVQFHGDGTGLKIQSLVLEKEETSLSKGVRFVYNFSKKSLECVQMDCEQGKSNDQSLQESKRKDGEVQTLIRGDATKKSTKCQTVELLGGAREQSLQTEEKAFATNFVQTDAVSDRTVKNVRELKDFDISPGLYRMVKSKDVGKFYLYPEREDVLRMTPDDSSESKSKACDDESERKLLNMKKSFSNLVSAKEMRVLYQDRSRGRVRRIKKRNTSGKVTQEHSKEERADSKLDNSVSCLFFRKSRDGAICENDTPLTMEKEDSVIETEGREATTAGERGVPLAVPPEAAPENKGVGRVEETRAEMEKGIKVEKAEETEGMLREVNLDGCFWFWNGEMIKPGCDLKTHVENLLREKLKEMNRMGREPGVGSRVYSKESGEGMESARVVGRRCSEKDLSLNPDSNGVFCFRKDDVTQLNLSPFIPEFPAGSCPPRISDQTAKKRCVRNVGTQNSQNAFLSLNVNKLKKKSKIGIGHKENGEKQKRKSSERGETIGLKAVADLVKAVREIRKLQVEADREKESSLGSSSGTDATRSSSSTKRDELDRSTSSVLNARSHTGCDTQMEDKGSVVRVANIQNADRHRWNQKEERQQSSFKENPMDQFCRPLDSTDQKHWELIESILNRVSLRERESLWNDIREFIKKKIGRDIDDEGAREVCIEIEQDVPKSGLGKRKHMIMARGHYVRNGGDVEVEIDLTLEDLEKILRQRHRRMHRRQVWNSIKGKKLFSSSSAQSGLIKYESRREMSESGTWKNPEGNSPSDDNLQDQALPLPIQIFLWRQISPFIRPKLGKLHEASCMELKEACKSFEKILVQNIQYGLSPSLTAAMGSVPRWRLIQAAFPYVMHCAATLLHNRKDTNLQNLGATESKMLYTLHWILLVAAEECADADRENGIFQPSPFYYLFSVPAITLFIYLFAPIYHHLKESDFQTYRLENGLKMWQALWDYKHPDTPCFTAHVKPKPRMLSNRFIKGSHLQFGDVFMGRQQSAEDGLLCGESPQSQSASASFCSEQYAGVPAPINVRVEPAKSSSDEEGNWVSSPKDTVFPETIPEESSSTEEEHVVIFRLPSLTESDGVVKPGSLYTADSTLFHVSMSKNVMSRSMLTIERVTALSGSDVRQSKGKAFVHKMGSSTDRESVSSSKGQLDSASKLQNVSVHSSDVCAATFLDVAVLRCLFMSQWPEEGVYWALQFYYHRLREISEETNEHQLPRRRSNSLPIPKIEVSLYQSPELKKKDPNKDFMEVPEVKDVTRLAESPYFGWKQNEDSSPHSRRASEKSTTAKRKMKMADLRAFVETKLLSKSERTLEKIGADEPKSLLLQQEYHHSLDAGDDHLSRPASSVAKIFEHKTEFKPLGWGNLVKGKSMPSLSCLTDEGSVKGYMGDQEKQGTPGKMLGAHSHTITNPIITVTEHTPAPSPDFLKRQVSVESQMDENSFQSSRPQIVILPQERKLSLTRSQTDSNITYACDELLEAPGASYYITKDGDINIQVVLKAVHSAALRDNVCCTLRVCEVIFNLLELLMDMGVLKQNTGRGDHALSPNECSSGKEDRDSCHSSEHEETKEEGTTSKNANEKPNTSHDLLLNTVLRVYRHLGCPHGCGDSQRGPPADFLRSQGQTILSKLQRSNPKKFSKFLRNFVRNQSLSEILEFFHSYVGFCVDPASLLSPLRMNHLWLLARKAGQIYDQKRSSNKSPEIVSQSAYWTNLTGSGFKGAGGTRGIESQIVTAVFKTLVSRLVKSLKELKSQENVPLYCDVRSLMAYIKEAHGGVFRRVAFSGLIDSASRPNKKQDNVQTTRVVRHVSHSETEEQTDLPGSSFYLDEKGQKKLLFKKKSTSSACAGTLDTEGSEEDGKSQSPLGNMKKKHQAILTPRQSEKNIGITDACRANKGEKGSKLIPKIGNIVNWFKKEQGRSESGDSHDETEMLSHEGGTLTRQQSLHHSMLGKSSSKGSSGDLKQALQKTRKRVEDQLKKNFGFRKGKRKDGSLEETSGAYLSRKNSLDYSDPSREADYVIFRERKLVPLLPVLHGMMRFSFLLETCQPGSVPDQHLLAAILDLPHAPVVSRAAFLLECAFFVHNCNKGQWPAWMKLNFPVFRPSMPVPTRGAHSGMRRTHIQQRTSGKLFYQWAEALSGRLEEMLQKDRLHIPDVVSMVTEESHQKELLIEDEEEDFLDEASVNLCGNECPIALRMIACILLLEITAFLRETYPSLPKSRACGRDRPPPWERMYSKEANRRWSMALSSMGHSQTSAQSLQSIAGDRETVVQAERKISFVLHEPDNESEGSSNTTVTLQGEEADEKDRKRGGKPLSNQTQNRPFLLRRGTATNATGSFKRRSLKLRRGTKEGLRESDGDFKRTDSIQSKRKVSSLSDRSDTSEPGATGEVSGEESPGILSDDQPPESPSDSNDTDDTSKNMPWMKVVVQFAHSFNFYCSHQSFCHPFCYRRHMRACERLMKAVRKVYGEENAFMKCVEEEVGEKHQEVKKEKLGRSRKESDQVNLQLSPVRRKDSLGKKEKPEGKQKDLEDVEKNKLSDFGGRRKAASDKPKEIPPILKYLKSQVKNVFHAPLSVLVKGAVVLSEDLFVDIMPVAWELLLESDQEVAATAASLFILCSVRAPNHASDLMHHALSNQDTSVRINAILRFQVLWKLRYQVWPRMEEGAHVTFKVPPPGIEFTLPSPKIGIESLPVVDPPWVPQIQTKVEEVTISQESHRALVTATKTRKKQQTELITMALQAQEDKKRVERENFLITTIPVTVQAAYQPSLYHAVGDDHDEGDEDQGDTNQGRNPFHHTNAVHSLFPSCLCSAVIQIISLLDDAAVSSDGNAVYEVAYSVIWNCLVEDSALFLRYILERITREKQDQMFKILRHLIRFVPKLPQQAAFALYNYIIGYVMFYVRSSHEEGQQYIGIALSILWMVVHSVHGIMFKDLKQILRKEQCDASILLTANVPSAKKIIVHGPQEQDAGGIPSQFPVQEDTQFCQILRESLDFFGVDENKHREYFLVDHKTRQIHNPSSYVRDFYFFKRSQYPQLELVHMKPEDAFNGLQRQELIYKFVEIGKVLLTWAILKNVDMVVQRVVFLHEELMKLPSFPRKALEADLDLYKKGELGKELLGLDVLHKFMWVRLIARMFEAMAGNFAYSGDIHLLLNVLNGALILHSEDSCILRYVMATYINAAHNFKNIFSTNGYLLIMPTLLQIYSNHQTNKLVTRTVEYCVKQFYLMNRKPFILQMFGSLSAILDTEEEGQYGDAHKVQAKCLFQLLLSLETPSPDPLNIAELVKEDKPLKAIDFCYHDESEMVTVLDCISLCVMVIAYASDSVRGHQMLIILEAILPYYLQQIQKPSYEKDGKTEKEIIQQLAVAIRTLVHNCEALAKNYNGPQRSSPEHKGSSQRNYSRGPYSPGYEFDEDSHSRYLSDHSRSKLHYERGEMEDSEVLRNEFRRPRDILLSLVADFHSKCTSRLAEINKKSGSDGKTVEILDVKSHLRLVDIAHSLLKVAPYDPDTMGCRGLQRYVNDVLPSTEWSNDAMRPALITILRRLDKTFNKIYKKSSIRRHTDWDAAAGLLKGIYETLARCPYIVHMQHLKTLINTCQSLILGDASNFDVSANEPLVVRILMAMVPPPHFCSTVVRLIVMQILLMGVKNDQNEVGMESYSLEQVCGSSVFPNKKKTESMLMNLIIPLCMRVGSGRKDVPRMRQQDISFALTVVLHAMCPPATLTAQNIKSLSEMRSGSLAVGKETKKPVRLPQSTYQVSFLALKIIMVCFENELTNDWHRIAKTVKDVGRILDLGCVFWDFLDFVASQRTPLFVLLLPFINQKVNGPPLNDQQCHMQFVIREKLRGYSLPVTKCKSALLVDLAREIKELKEELKNGKIEDARGGGDQMNLSNSQSGDIATVPYGRHHRPSLIGGLFSGASEAKSNQYTSANEIQMKLVRSQRNSLSSGGDRKIEDTATAGPGIAADENSAKTSKGTYQKDGNSEQTRKSSVKLRFTSNVEMKDDSGETSITPLSPGSPNDESSGETGKQNKPRLQRSKAQSRKTFRLRKSRKSRMESGDVLDEKVKKQSYSTPATPTQITPQTQKLFLEQLKEAKLKDILAKEEAKSEESTKQTWDGHGRDSASGEPYISDHNASGSGQNLKKSEEGGALIPGDRIHSSQAQFQSYKNNNFLTAELSVDDDTSAVSQTSSTSGYRESCSLITMTMESPTPQRPSSVPATTSPESSLTSIDGDETAVLARSSSSQHSLMMLFETQDEDTLI